MRVSVIMPCLNAGVYLESAIESVFAQQLARECSVELIFIDDGSDDPATLASIAKFSKDPRFHLIRNAKPQGISRARNLGLKEATGDFIAFLDSDDIWEPWHLATHIEIQRTFNAQFSATDYARIDEGGQVKEQNCLWTSEVKGPPLRSALGGEERGALRKPVDIFVRLCPAWTGAVVVQRSALSATGGFNEALKVAEDVELLIRLARVFDFAFSNKQTAFYRRNSASITNTITSKKKDLASAEMFHELLAREEFKAYAQQLRYAAATDYLSAAYTCRKAGERAEAFRCVKIARSLEPFGLRSYKEFFKTLIA